MSAPVRSTMVLGVMLGAGVGLVMGAPVAFVVARQLSQPTVEAWHLVPVVVAAVDISAGTTLTMEQLSQRSMPARFVSDAYVKPDGAGLIINTRVVTPIEAGAPLSTWMVDVSGTTPPAEAATLRRCVERAREVEGDAGTPGVSRLIDALERRAASVRP